MLENHYRDLQIVSLPKEKGEHCYDYYYRKVSIERNWKNLKCVVARVEATASIQTLRIEKLSPNLLIAACKDNSFGEWDLDSGDCISEFSVSSGNINHFDVDYFRLIVSDKDGVKIFDRHSHHELFKVEKLLSQVNRVNIFGEYFLLGLWDGFIQIHNINTGAQISRLVGHNNYRINGMDLRDDLLVSASSDKTVKLWHINSNSLIKTLKGHSKMVNDVQLTFHNRNVFSASKDCTVRSWDIHSDQCAQRIYETGTPVNAFKHDGICKFVTGGDDGLVKLWDTRMRDANCYSSLKGHSGPINTLYFDEWRVISGSSDKTIRIWDFRN